MYLLFFLSIIYQNFDYTINKEECPMESLKQHLTQEGEEILEVIEEIKQKLKPFIKENLKRLNLTDFDDWGVMDEL